MTANPAPHTPHTHPSGKVFPDVRVCALDFNASMADGGDLLLATSATTDAILVYDVKVGK
jgi:hypothetical protein